MADPPLTLTAILGSRLDPALADALHALEHDGAVDHLHLPPEDIDRRRLRTRTERGQEVLVALPRDAKLFDGAVLLLSAATAIVVRVTTRQWLRLRPESLAAAIELGYSAGNLHWRVRFDGTALLVALEAPKEDYLARLGPLVGRGAVTADVVPE
jgi:urease accessory protein